MSNPCTHICCHYIASPITINPSSVSTIRPSFFRISRKCDALSSGMSASAHSCRTCLVFAGFPLLSATTASTMWRTLLLTPRPLFAFCWWFNWSVHWFFRRFRNLLFRWSWFSARSALFWWRCNFCWTWSNISAHWHRLFI